MPLLATTTELKADFVDPDLSIYDTKYGNAPYDYTPHCIYFYYLRINEDGALAVDHYLYGQDQQGEYSANRDDWQPIAPEAVADLTRELAINARPRTTVKSPPKLPDHNFNNMRWDRRSHLVIFLDEKMWTFHRKDQGIPAVTVKALGGPSEANVSFFDAEDLTVEIDGPTDRRSAVRLINHMKSNASGETLGDELIDYKLDFYVSVAFAVADERSLTVIFDPPGGNQGPPGQP